MIPRAMKARRIATFLALLLAVSLAMPLLGGCSSSPPKPTKEQIEAQQRAAEAKRRAEEEKRREEEARRQAEREREQVREAFGPIGPTPGEETTAPEAAVAPSAPAQAAVSGAPAEAAVPGAPAQAAAPGAAAAPAAPAAPVEIPFDKAVPPLPPEPTVRVVVLSHDVPLAEGRRVALQIGTYDRERIEARLGKAVKIVYVAESKQPLPRPSEIHYRKDFLLAAQSVASAMASQQYIGPMTPHELHQDNVDLVVHIGKGYH